MGENQAIKAFVDYGFAIVGLVITARFLAWLIKYILERNKAREDIYMEVMKNDLKHLTESMGRLTDNITNFSNNVNEAHKFQREEHAKMTENQISVCGSLKQVEQALGRINGYTDGHH